MGMFDSIWLKVRCPYCNENKIKESKIEEPYEIGGN